MPAPSRTAIRNALVTAVLLAACAQDRVTGPSSPRVPKSLGPQAGYYGDQGCTPGFWKNHPDLEFWYYLPGEGVDPVFDVPDSFGLDNFTLLEALSFSGGPGETGAAQILLRAAVAALLNGASPVVDYPLDQSTVISVVNAALASGDRDTMLSLAGLLDYFNNFGCPL
jgi:hypothetical protein